MFAFLGVQGQGIENEKTSVEKKVKDRKRTIVGWQFGGRCRRHSPDFRAWSKRGPALPVRSKRGRIGPSCCSESGTGHKYANKNVAWHITTKSVAKTEPPRVEDLPFLISIVKKWRGPPAGKFVDQLRIVANANVSERLVQARHNEFCKCALDDDKCTDVKRPRL